MNKKFPLIALFVLCLGLIAGGYFIFWGQSSKQPLSSRTPSPSSQSIVGNDKDEHGCIGSAGYQWCEPKNKCLRIWEEACYASPEQEIQFLLAEKYNKSADEVTVIATKKNANYMVGSVSFAVESLPATGAGGLFLAARNGNVWTLVFDGNGSIDCEKIKRDYDFTAEMLKGICD